MQEEEAKAVLVILSTAVLRFSTPRRGEATETQRHRDQKRNGDVLCVSVPLWQSRFSRSTGEAVQGSACRPAFDEGR